MNTGPIISKVWSFCATLAIAMAGYSFVVMLTVAMHEKM
ncbi:hypothetical protein LCGC14_0056870 [marine sediment metagenome]|uniref:Uncharacterized protein n=1 Tax=marine sediment metagenome TaxID=412755 RepID=A0A0F9YQR3_9ZZZZ